jgi:hypothetical protein
LQVHSDGWNVHVSHFRGLPHHVLFRL